MKGERKLIIKNVIWTMTLGVQIYRMKLWLELIGGEEPTNIHDLLNQNLVQHNVSEENLSCLFTTTILGRTLFVLPRYSELSQNNPLNNNFKQIFSKILWNLKFKIILDFSFSHFIKLDWGGIWGGGWSTEGRLSEDMAMSTNLVRSQLSLAQLDLPT